MNAFTEIFIPLSAITLGLGMVIAFAKAIVKKIAKKLHSNDTDSVDQSKKTASKQSNEE